MKKLKKHSKLADYDPASRKGICNRLLVGNETSSGFRYLGDLDLSDNIFEKFSDIGVKIDVVEGSLNISNNRLESLEGFPSIIQGDLNISYNPIKSLDKDSKDRVINEIYVRDDFICKELDTADSLNLEYIHFGKNLDCSGSCNPFGFKGLPKMIHGDLIAVGCGMTIFSKRYEVEYITGKLDLTDNCLISNLYVPEVVSGGVILRNNPMIQTTFPSISKWYCSNGRFEQQVPKALLIDKLEEVVNSGFVQEQLEYLDESYPLNLVRFRETLETVNDDIIPSIFKNYFLQFLDEYDSMDMVINEIYQQNLKDNI